ncbi:MAG: lyase family protein [Nitrososphaerota archaeon]
MAFRKGRLEGEVPERVARYISSLEEDEEILDEVLAVNAAHLRSLRRMGLISDDVLERALGALRGFPREALRTADPRLEDVHMVVEEHLRSEVPEAGENLALGKSRNDAVSAAIRMRVRRFIAELVLSGTGLAEPLLSKAEEYAETLFPLHTHEQPAAPGTLGFVLSCHASRLLKALRALASAYGEVNASPLGAGPVGGTSVPHDRLAIAEDLGFDGVVLNALEASSSRDFALAFLCGLLRVSLVLTDLAEELVRYVSQNPPLLDFDDAFFSTSSIMPHKRNPVVAEVARTSLSRVLGELVRFSVNVSRRFGGYVLDLQESTEPLWRAARWTLETLEAMAEMVQTLRPGPGAGTSIDPKTGLTEYAAWLTLTGRLTFRRAHLLCGRIASMLHSGASLESVEAYLTESGLDREAVAKLREFLEPRRVIGTYAVIGSSRPDEVRRSIGELVRECGELKAWATDRLRFEEERRARVLGGVR